MSPTGGPDRQGDAVKLSGSSVRHTHADLPTRFTHLSPQALWAAFLTLVLIFGRALPAANFFSSPAHYLPLHTGLEFVAMAVSAMVFALAWNLRRQPDNSHLIILGTGFLAVGLIDFAHTLSFAGMPDFITPSGTEKAINLWLFGRLVAAAVLITVALRPITRWSLRSCNLAVIVSIGPATCFSWIGISPPEWFPRTFVAGQGLTSFKIWSEYVLAALYGTAAFLLFVKGRRLQDANLLWLAVGSWSLGLAELFFTLYSNVTDIFNLLGHVYKSVAYLMVYRALFVEGVQAPMRALRNSETRFRAVTETARDAIVTISSDGAIVQWNRACEEMFGYVGIDLSGKPVSCLMPQRFREAQAEVLRRHLVGDMPPLRGRFVEMHGLRQDGTEFPLVLSVSHWDTEEGRFFTGFMRDNTERKQAEDRLRAFLENSAVIAWMKDAQGRYAFASDNFLKRFGFTAQEVLGKTDTDLWPGETATLVQKRDSDVFLVEGIVEVVDPVIEKSGKRTWWLKHKFVFDDSVAGRLVGGLGVDVTAAKVAEEQLRKLSLAVEQSPESIVITNLKGDIEYVNEAFVQKTGYSREEAIGKNPRILNSGKTPAETFTAMWEALTRGQPWKGNLHNRRKDGSEYIEHAVITPIRQPDGIVTHYVAVKEDITTQKASEDRINTLAFFDPLTNLPNRRLLLDRLKQALASSGRSGRYGALLFIDLDNFKTLNDTLGHDIGDLLLQQVAQRLITCIREGDTVSRLGGDEFVVMLEDLSETIEGAAAHAKTVGEKILAALNQPYQLAAYPHHSTPSMGVTLFSDQQETIDELLKRADLAMYQAKAAGRNTLRFFDPEMQAVVTARAAMEADLRDALSKGQFLLHYQAQVIGEGRVTGAEVLLRWQHPQRGMVSPADFIPLAEDTGLILPIGHWVLQTACVQLARWAARPELAHLTISVNVSARQFRHKDVVEQVLAVLDQTGANPQRLKLELTESLLVDDVESVINKMAALKMKGVGFSMDDFGTGYSSLSYLKRLPLDQLKIDQGFVRNILTDPNEAAIARTVVVLAESLGLVVIAEGVETEPQREFLAHHGCHAYQGYLFSRPLPLDEFERLACEAFDNEQRLLRA